MKLRLGFVSNSSSSCFICNTDKTEEEIVDYLKKLLDIYNEGVGTSYTFEECFKPIRVGGECDEKELNNWDEQVNALGKVLIESEDDNSIPYQLFEIIEEAFDATRIHMG